MPGVEHRSHKGLNNRAENSHQPIRRRERIMKRFKSTRQLQRFDSIHDPIANLFHFPRHNLSASDHRDPTTHRQGHGARSPRPQPLDPRTSTANSVAEAVDQSRQDFKGLPRQRPPGAKPVGSIQATIVLTVAALLAVCRQTSQPRKQ